MFVEYTNAMLNDAELTRLLEAGESDRMERRLTEKRRWGNLPFDMQAVRGATITNDIDLRLFELEYLPAAVSPEVLESNKRDSGDQLRALRLITQDDLPTVTAILMLGKRPLDWFPGAFVQYVRYDGGEISDPIMNQRKISGSLPDQMRQVDELLKLNIITALETGLERHREMPDYPDAALIPMSPIIATRPSPRRCSV